MTPIPCRLNAMPYDSRVLKPIKNIIVYSKEASSQNQTTECQPYFIKCEFDKGLVIVKCLQRFNA